MPYLKTFETKLIYNADVVRIITDHYSLLPELMDFVQREEPDCYILFHKSGFTWATNLNNHGEKLGEQIVGRMQRDGWQHRSGILAKGFHEIILEREELFTSVADDLERLIKMRDSGEITTEEFEEAKRLLIVQS